MSYYGAHYKRETLSMGSNTSGLGKKKVKNFSYSTSDRIGKGFSSVVYKGTNDSTSK